MGPQGAAPPGNEGTRLGGDGVPQRSVASRPTGPQTAPPPVFGVLEAHHGPSAGAEAQTSDAWSLLSSGFALGHC